MSIRDGGPRPLRLSGVFPVLATPFGADGKIDILGFGRIVRLVIAAGADGLVYPANASEFETLTREEREALLEVVFELARGRVPVIVGASASDASEAASLAGLAARFGASAVMVMPSASLANDAKGLRNLFHSVADSVSAPIILQNAPPPLGAALSSKHILELLADVPAIRYVKEETLPSGLRVTEVREAAPKTLDGIFGGAGGRYIMGELARGVVGCMPSCECTEIHVAIFREYKNGNVEAARDIFNQVIPLLSFVSVFRASAVKEALRQRGIIDCAGFRSRNSAELDEFDRRELGAILSTMQHLFDAGAARAAIA